MRKIDSAQNRKYDYLPFFLTLIHVIEFLTKFSINLHSFVRMKLSILYFVAVRPHLPQLRVAVDQLREMENADLPTDPALADLLKWASADSATSAPTSSSRPTTSTSTPSTARPSASAELGAASASATRVSPAASASATASPSASATPSVSSTPTPSTSASSNPVVVVVEDEVRREHGIKGSLDAKVKGTSLPAIELSLSWNNSSRVTTTSKKTLPPVHYPQLPLVDPTPIVQYPPVGPASVVPDPDLPAQASVASTEPAVSATFRKPQVVSAPVASATPIQAGPSGSSEPRPDSGLGTSDSETPAYLTCVESSESSDESDSDNEMSPSAPTDSDDELSDEEVDQQPQASQAPLVGQLPTGQVAQVGQVSSTHPTPAVVQAQVAGVPQAGRTQDRDVLQGAARGSSRSRSARSTRGRVRDRGARARARGRRQRRARKREWEESEESLSPADEEASFPSRISPRNKKPYQGYTKF